MCKFLANAATLFLIFVLDRVCSIEETIPREFKGLGERHNDRG